ncbi:hypothetical protein FA95DRAFT_1613876 [Auriscalpium vulgare]|uniref:Uncharacterized protein n=1 Tax=Auriscalpium vulgare TaxID=40419 RepID=A0ACB8R0Y8_9AGAM|nr:hypothetical protein FA95DRAFT_1613876 [Auriscalpium vulgare]
MATELPLDVQIIVIEWVFRSSQHRAAPSIDYPTLHACALVCRAWTPVAQRLLYRRIRCTHLQHPHCDIELLVRALCARPHLAAHVRSIAVAWPSHPRVYASLCLRLLELCRHVEGISFCESVSNNKALTAASDARMRAIRLRPVVLEVVGLRARIGRTIVRMFPSARTIVLSRGYEDPLPAASEALEILADCTPFCLSHARPLPVLRYLCLIHPYWEDKALQEHIISTGLLPQLQSLQIKGEFPPTEVLEHLVQLRTLVVDHLPVNSVTLLPSLRHVGYHTRGELAETTELAVDPLRSLPELQRVTATRCGNAHVLAALEAMCRARGVDFGVYEAPEHVQQPQDIDWI